MAEATIKGWAILELMGHRRLGGYLSEQEVAGAAMLRIDVPANPWRDGCTCGSDEPDTTDHEKHTPACQMFRAPGDDEPRDVFATQLYSSAAVYCITPTTEEIARGVAQMNRPAPVYRFELEPARAFTGRDENLDEEQGPF